MTEQTERLADVRESKTKDPSPKTVAQLTTDHQQINDRQSRDSTTPSKVAAAPSNPEFREVSRAVRFKMWRDLDRLHPPGGDRGL